MQTMQNREYAFIAVLAALSAIVELIHIGYRSPVGIWIDIVAVPWIMAFFLFGIRGAFITSLIGALIIGLFSPASWLGASLKWIPTLPMWFCLYLWMVVTRQKLSAYKKVNNLIVPTIAALIIRCMIILPVDYYFAIPIFTGMTSAQSMAAIPWYIIVLLNLIQGIIDVGLAWIIVFKFKLFRFASWNE